MARMEKEKETLVGLELMRKIILYVLTIVHCFDNSCTYSDKRDVDINFSF